MRYVEVTTPKLLVSRCGSRDASWCSAIERALGQGSGGAGSARLIGHLAQFGGYDELLGMREAEKRKKQSELFRQIEHSSSSTQGRGTGNKAAISAVTTAQTQAERNDFTHSFMTTADDGTMKLVRRNIRGGNYSVSLRDVNATAMRDHGFQFANAAEAAMKALEITAADVDRYSREIESHA
jgi:hypothetical protein